MKNILTLIKTYWIALSLVILAIITVLSLWPLDTLPEAPGSDKLHHFIAYAFLILPASVRKHHQLIRLFLLYTAYSAAVELIQPYVNRYCDWRDLLANVSGLACGVVLAVIFNFLFPTNTVTPLRNG